MERWALARDVRLDGSRIRGPAHHQEGGADAFLCLLKKVVGPIRVHVDNKGVIDGLWRGEGECIKPRAEDADVWIKIWEALHYLAERSILVEVEHVKAHRTTKQKKEMSHFEKFVTEGNEKADEMATAGTMLDKGFMAEGRAKTVQQERQEVYAALQVRSQLSPTGEERKDCEELRPKPKEKWNFGSKREETNHRAEWCAEASTYRCMRCERGSKYMKMPGKCTGPKYLSKYFWKMGKASPWRS